MTRSTLALPAVPAAGGVRSRLPRRWILVAAVLTVWFVWGSTFLGIRIMVETIPPLVGSGVRFLAGGAVLAAVVLVTDGRRAFAVTGPQLRGAAALGLLLVAAGVGLVALAEERHVPSSLVALLASSEAAMVLGLRVVAGRERISPATLVGVVVGVAGVAILMLPGGRPSGVAIGAVLIALAGSVAWATGTFVGSRIPVPRSLLAGIAIQMLVGGAVLLAAGVATGERVDPGAVSGASASALVGLTLASVAVYVAYGWLLRNASLSVATTQAYVNPLVAVALGALLVGEHVATTTAVGMVVTLVAVALVLRAERRTAPVPGAGAA